MAESEETRRSSLSQARTLDEVADFWDTSWWHRPLACARSQDGCATISSTPSVVYECFVV